MKLHREILILLLVLAVRPAVALTFSPTPLFIASTEPRIMLLLSRDHELYKKAYTDYSDLDGDGILDSTYKDSVEYYGYFDPQRCYTYTGGRFEPGNAATGPHLHHCSGAWSGNFMNWSTMTRMDIVRKVLYGGLRSTDNNGSALGDTVLERALIPSDVHAFAKVFAPPGGSSEVALYVPSSVVSANAVTLCNVTRTSIPSSSGTVGQGTLSRNVTDPPMVRIAEGSWGQWAASEIIQCRVNTDTSGGNTASTRPPSATDFNVRVAVCAPGKLESNCKTYPSGAVKPTGLLQKYGDTDAERPVRFGLITGSYGKNKSGGVLRRNTSKIAGNASSSANEIDSNTGQFTGNAGIIDTINRLRISNFEFGDRLGSTRASNQYFENPPGSGSGGCQSPGTTTFSEGKCPDWGNPLSEMYFEALRYFAGKTGPTSGFVSTDSSYLSSALPSATWSDPLPSTEWCALSNIIVLSTGLNSFDGDAYSDAPTGINVDTLTDNVGTAEGLAGATVLAGGNSSTHDKQCTAKAIGNLSEAKGICPEMPNVEGTYKIAGLAYANRTVDLRPGYAADRANRWTGINPDWVARQPMGTYAVALAENLPEFSVTTQSGDKIKFLPACQAHASWTPCTLTDIRVETSTSTTGSFLAVWEDSQWGYDYDMDAISRISWCVGSACSPTVGANQVRFTVSLPQKVSGASMRFGVITTGTTADGLSATMLSAPSSNYTCTTTSCTASTPASAPTPLDLTYTAGSSPALTLHNPLWYAAKYGAPASAWDLENNDTGAATPDGIPDHFFEVRNPGTLDPALSKVFDAASQPDASAASVATNTTTLQTQTRVFQAKFSSADWSGQLLSYPFSQTTGQLGTPDWDAGSVINGQSPSSRVILTKGSTGDGVAFAYGNLTGPSSTAGTQKNLLDNVTVGATTTTDGCGPERVAYLRGDDSHEGASGSFSCASSTTIGNFRVRSSKLGDIVNSNPWYVGAPAAGYSDVDYAGYSIFRAAKINRTPVVYVGANDGMLHGFNAELDFSSSSAGVVTANSGKEVLGYVPSGSYANLSRLTHSSYNKNHRYIMDGSPMVGDADVAADGTPTYTPDWRSVLVGGLGAGGVGYYALDVSDPSAFSESGTAPADTLLWEFTDADDGDMGYAFNQPAAHPSTNYPKQIVRMANGKWAVILGNGYNSASGKAALYVLFIKEGLDGVWTAGSDYIKIVADSSGNNGLSTPVPFDMDGDGTVDVVYAGDLKGNLWKFLVGDANPANWQVDFSTATCGASSSCVPLFVAEDAVSPTPNRQPILWPPEVTHHPSGTGAMVFFGTGKYLESGDVGTTAVQTYYGVWDNNDATIATTGTPAGTRASGLTPLSVSQGSQTVGGVSYDTRTVTGTSGTNGWYLDLPTSGERATGIPKLVNGVLYFNTFIPSSSPCDAGGTGWLMAVNYFTGTTPSHQVFPQFGTTPIAGVRFGAALGGTTLIQSSGSSMGYAVMSLTQGNIATVGNTSGAPQINFGPYSRGRVNWREIVQ